MKKNIIFWLILLFIGILMIDIASALDNFTFSVYNVGMEWMVLNFSSINETTLKTSTCTGGNVTITYTNCSSCADRYVDVAGDTMTGNLTILADLNVTGTNGTFMQDVTILGTLYGGSPVKISGVNISNNLFELVENRNSSLRFTLQNLNNGSNATTIISAINDVGGTMNIRIGSSSFMLSNNSYANITALFSRSRGKTVFANFFNQMFLWLVNPSDDNNASNLVELMRLDGNGLNVSVFNTGDVLSGDIESHFGQNKGAIAIGDVELFISEISLSGLDLNGTFVTRNRDGQSNIKFAWVGANNKVRLAIPKEEAEFAIYNPRSSLTGGDLGQAFDDGMINCTAQGYNNVSRGDVYVIDCNTSNVHADGLINSGADKGIADDLLIGHDLKVWNNAYIRGNITSANVFIPQYIFAHNNATIEVNGANLWTNITFDQEEADIKFGIIHLAVGADNHTFTINQSGIYDISFNLDIIDTSAGASDVDVAARAIYTNGTEIIGSVFEIDIIKQQIESELSHEFLARLNVGDKIIFQFTATDADIEMSTHGTFGDHPDSGTITIKKIANI